MLDCYCSTCRKNLPPKIIDDEEEKRKKESKEEFSSAEVDELIDSAIKRHGIVIKDTPIITNCIKCGIEFSQFEITYGNI